MTKILEVADSPTKEQVARFETRQRVKSLRHKIENEAGDTLKILGTVSDAAQIAIDDSAMSTLAMNSSSASSYRTVYISLYEQLHGAGSWELAVENAQAWFDGRVAATILSTVDLKGRGKVFNDMAACATAVAKVLESK